MKKSVTFWVTLSDCSLTAVQSLRWADNSEAERPESRLWVRNAAAWTRAEQCEGGKDMNLEYIPQVAWMGAAHVLGVGSWGKQNRNQEERLLIFIPEMLSSPIHWYVWTLYRIRCTV